MQRLPDKLARFLRRLGRLADAEGIRLYLVGGVVRDLLLKRNVWDLDVTVEGDGVSFARLVAKRFGAGLALFERFATARLVFPDGLKVDIASTRRESYADPAALPDVVTAALEEDLFRRDFTVNAMALELNIARWGLLHDPYGGRRDLKGKRLRVLHRRSFVDDPTRIFRAIRFAERFGFRFEANTGRLLADAAATDLVARLSGPRLANEIFALMKERRPQEAIRRLRRLRLLRFVHPRLALGKRNERLMAVLPKAMRWWERRCPKAPLDRAMLRVMTLLAYAAPATICGAIQRLQLSAAQARTLECAGEQSSNAAALLSSQAAVPPSVVYRKLVALPNEALVLVLAKSLISPRRAGSARFSRRLNRFVTRDRHVTARINGDGLKQLGLRPGPHFKTILDQLLDERLDGRISAAAQERERACALVKHYG
jgi:tRNA nucleotidyltransferase (CCA-adding enzyme)